MKMTKTLSEELIEMYQAEAESLRARVRELEEELRQERRRAA